MKVEFLEDVKEGVIPRCKGDVATICGALGEAYVKAGICKNVETGEANDRKEGCHSLDVDSAVIKVKA